MLSIQTNVNSLIAQQNLNINNEFQSQTIQQLTSGYRINSSGDDAAGLAVANKYRSSVAELTQGVANGNDGSAQLQIMDGGMSNISQILDRLKTLATQSASGTFTGDRTTVNSEFQTDLSEIDRQAQSIGLNTGGTFNQNLDVYLGTGSGSQSLQNGIVTLNLSSAAVDSQALGLVGMEAVNLTSGSLSGTNVGTDLGASSTTSVADIVGNTSGAHANQEATAGYAAMQFSGAGFSDAGAVPISINLAGVTDTATLVTAVNNAIQAAGTGSSAAATAFKNANIVASVHTDSNGGQELAFSSSTTAFQVQAGDQMGNALLGNVSVVGGVAQGTAVSGTAATTVTGADTTAGTGFTQNQIVKLVVNGGGLASPVTLQVNTGSGAVTTSAAITDLKNQFGASAALQAAGLSMSGSATPGTALSFNSATGEAFNVQVTGDFSNLLGLGSFLTDSSGNADYSSITGASYSNTTLAGGIGTTTGLAAGLEVSINGQASTALSTIDLTAGASATVATITGGGIGASAVDVLATNNNLNITVTNNGSVDNQVFSISPTAQVATSGTSTATLLDSTYTPSTHISAANHNNEFNVSVNGAAAQLVTIADGTYTTKDDFLGALNTALTSMNVTATWGTAGNDTGALTLSSNTLGSVSSIAASQELYSTKAALSAGTLTDSTYTASTHISAAADNNLFTVSVDGGAAQTIQIADGTYTTADDFLAAVNTALSGKNITATWGTAGTDHGLLTLTSTAGATGSGSSVSVGQVTYNSQAALSAGTLSNSTYVASTHISAANHNNLFTVSVDGAAAQTIQIADGTYTTADDFLAGVNLALSGKNITATWGTAGNDTGLLTLTATAGGASGTAASVSVGQVTYNSQASLSAGSLTDSTYTASTHISAAQHNNLFTVSVNGAAAQTIQIADGTYTTADDFLAGVNLALSGKNITATWGTAGTDHGLLTLTATAGAAAGSAASVSVGQVTYNSQAALSAGTLSNSTYTASTQISAALNNNTFNISVDGGASQLVTIADGTYTTADDFLGAVNSALSGKNVTATWGTAGNDTGVLTLTTTGAGATGTGGSVAVTQTTYTTKAQLSTSTLTSTGYTPSTVITASTNDSFMVSVDGGTASSVAIAAGTYTTADDFLAGVNLALSGKNIIATWGTAGNDTGALTFTSTGTNTGINSFVTVSTDGTDTGVATIGYSGGASAEGAVNNNTGITEVGLTDGAVGHGANNVANTGIGKVGLTDGAVGHGVSNVANTGITAVGLTDGAVGHGANGVTNTGLAEVGLTNNAIANGSNAAVNAAFTLLGLSAILGRGQDDAPSTLQSIATQIQNQFNGAATVTVSNTNQLIIASTTKGANSSVTIGTPVNHSANTLLHLTPGTQSGTNTSLADIVSNLNAQFAANSTYSAAGLTAAATASNGLNTGTYLTISSNNGTQFRLNSLGGGGAATSGAVASTVTQTGFSPITVAAASNNNEFKVAVDGGTATALTVADGTYSTASAFLTAIQTAISGSALNHLVTAGWDATTGALTLTSATTGNNSSVALTAFGGTGLTNFGFGASTGTGQQVTAQQNLGFGGSGASFTTAALNAASANASSTGTSMSALNAYGTSNSTAFSFSALKYGNDKQAITLSAKDTNGVLETETITLQNNTSANTAGANIDSAVAYINQQLQKNTSNPALQHIVAVKENVDGAEQINFVSSLSGFTVGVSGTGNGDGLNGGAAVQRASQANGSGATMSVDTQANAEAAVTAITTAVAALGSAQAAVGKGENQLNYGINLAQSQITNFSSAESQIRDANVAAEAANLSKAQVLQQSTIAAMAQANSAPQAVLSLLKS